MIVNADDYGFSPLFNKGILELAEKGIISSSSIMIKRKYIDTAVIKKFPKLSWGLHLELKERDTLKKMEEQIKKFVHKFGCLPSHLDGHKHMHVTKNNLPKIIKLAKKYDLPVRSEGPKTRKFFRKAKIKTPSNFIHWHPKRKIAFFQQIRNVRSGVSELACHPGYFDTTSSSSYNKRREQELKLLKSKKFRHLIKKFKVISYNEL